MTDLNKEDKEKPAIWESVNTLQKASLWLIGIEGSVALVVLLTPRSLSLWLGLVALIFVIPIFFIFLISLTYGPLARNLRLAITIGNMILSNTVIIIFLFANAYRWLQFKDGSLCFLDALYFAIVTWTTLGYGDIVPIGWARALAAIEALVGYLIMGLLVAALSVMAQRK